MSQRMANADAAWLHMDRPTNLMIVNSVWLFDEPLVFEDLRRDLHQAAGRALPALLAAGGAQLAADAGAKLGR